MDGKVRCHIDNVDPRMLRAFHLFGCAKVISHDIQSLYPFPPAPQSRQREQ